MTTTATPAGSASVETDRTLVQHTGWAYWPVAFIARLPFAMMTVGVLMLVVAATGSVAFGGLTSAAVGIGVVIAGPVIGDLVDRYGQRVVLVPVGLANGILLALFPLAVGGRMPDWAVLGLALAVGLSAPQAAAMSRSRLLVIVRDRIRPRRRDRTLARMMAYESAADETAFVIGPFFVGIAAALIAPWAPIAIAAALSFVFVTAFALHPTGRVTQALAGAGGTDVEQRAPMREVLRPGILVLVAATFAVGWFFGSTLTSLTAFAQARGDEAAAGLLYGLMGIGSAVLALAAGALPARFAMARRWIVFAGLLTVAAIGYAFADSFGAVTVMLLVMGLGVGPTLVTLFHLAGERAPAGRAATTLTLLGSALTLAQALACAVTGAIADAGMQPLAMALPAVAGAVVLGWGVANAIGGRAIGTGVRATGIDARATRIDARATR